MGRAYAPPRIEASHPVDLLLQDAAECIAYDSDRALKEDLRVVDGPVDRLTGIGTR